jgi:K+-sensing histidine kinase KdpD
VKNFTVSGRSFDMCHPAAAMMAIMVASAAMQAMAQHQQAKAQASAARAAGEYNAKVAANEAATQRSLAQAEIQKGIEERNRVLRAGMAKQGELAAGMGASGFTLDQGTNLSLLGQSAEEIQHDASIVTQSSKMDAWNRLAGATRAENEGIFARFSGENQAKQATAGLGLSMAGTILGGVGQGMGGYYNIKNTQTPKVA